MAAAPKTDFESNLARVLAERISGFMELASFERLSGGASQETYAINIETRDGPKKLAMRRAPGGILAEGRPGLGVEAKLMRLCRAQGVPEPEVYYVLEEQDGLGEGFIMEWLEGEALGARIVRSEALEAIRPKLARQCGEVLARIHAVDVKESGLAQDLEEVTVEQYVEQMWERYKLFETPQPMIDYTARWLLENLPPRMEPKLVHNDFRNGNIMVSPEGVVAVLDWETAMIGDPVRDLGWICTNSWRFGRTDLMVGGFGELDDLLAGYESVSGRAIEREHVHFWIVFGSYWWAVGCLGMAEHFRNGPDKTVERPAIGRRSSECQVDCVNLLIPGEIDVPEPRDLQSSLDMPRSDELMVSVRDFLRNDVMAETEGRINFLARVASNTMDILIRELEFGPQHRERELEGLQKILNKKGPLENLRWDLVNALRSGAMPLDEPDLARHLRQTVVTQIAIDQPKYSGYKTALENAKA